MSNGPKITFTPVRTTLSGRDSGKIRHWLIERDGKAIDRRYTLKDCKNDYPTGAKA